MSGVENAYLSYTGIKPFGGTLAIEGGIMDLPFTLGEATSSNDMLFMERASSQVIASTMAADDFRSAFGARWFNDRLWVGAYARVRPRARSIRRRASIQTAPPSNRHRRPHRGPGRERPRIFISPRRRRRIPADTAAQLITGARRSRSPIAPNCASIRPADSTGAIANVSGAQVYGVEAAGAYGPLFFQGEYYWFNVDRNAATGLPPLARQT